MAPGLFTRFPGLRPPQSYPALPDDAAARFPALAADLEVVERELAGPFETFDTAALRHQHRYRSQQVVVLAGSGLLAALGALQAVFDGQTWPGLVTAVLAVVVTAVAQFGKERDSLTAYLSERVKAERLRALQFRYLSRTGRFAGADRDRELATSVLAVKAGKERR